MSSSMLNRDNKIDVLTMMLRIKLILYRTSMTWVYKHNMILDLVRHRRNGLITLGKQVIRQVHS